ncbi:hypothetical protein DFW101_0035 [Solidesulfovibrio carbinoliphilus subsp. oakridgensis]|uniref:Uncharacterized protein n=1 Tax=Solidesulfovibrio carbinoliphilus subsp. oakridgensis TaxID=694327 RepID=G7QC17_9BACT|nr:hypothetical protein [Solidesulfovibrio carbinoliphilus]EHJ46052.1 hypothetical protein DFW101_0035 [Solidesulfovibrio carbinoliphilus subsp. oakridgensis]
MEKVLLSIVVAALLLASPLAATAAGPAPQPAAAGDGAPEAAPAPAKARPSTVKTDAAEARYRAWVDREHAKDATEFAKDKSKIEDKYKGYVKPQREKKDAKTGQAPAPGN